MRSVTVGAQHPLRRQQTLHANGTSRVDAAGRNAHLKTPPSHWLINRRGGVRVGFGVRLALGLGVRVGVIFGFIVEVRVGVKVGVRGRVGARVYVGF